MMWKDSGKIYLKGMAMGAADIVPGVSGGTVAFISGIYERLIGALSRFDISLLRVLRQGGLKGAWQHVDGAFLLILFAGILTSVFSAARILSYLLEHHAPVLWGFFFGLILASVYHVLRIIRQHTAATWLVFLLGAVIAYAITELSPAQVAMTLPNVFLAGAIAICAMILPGISGSFMLLLMGLYGPILGAVKGLELAVLAVFAAGCATGLLSFTHVLKWLLSRYHDLTLALLTGFMVGSLNKVWPWKQTLEYRLDSHGTPVPIIQKNVLPAHFEQVTGQSAELALVLVCFLLGLGLVLALERMGQSTQSAH